MNIRPDFSEIKTFEEFSKYYWYREELQKICRELGIDAGGIKAELNHNIEEYFKGNLIKPEKYHEDRKEKTKQFTGRRKNTAKSTHLDDDSSMITVSDSLSLQTGLIECRFCFSQRFRDFFSEQTGVKNFKFNVDMVATVRKVKETKDETFTIEDLLDIYYGRKTYATYDRVSLQWNKFVQDFCADPATACFSNKLKVAARLWKIVRESTREKVYKHELLEEFTDETLGFSNFVRK